MVNAVGPIADPIGFIVFFFVFNIGADLLGTIIKLAVLSSVIAFPFVLIGRWVYSWVEENVKSVHLVNLFLTSVITVLIFVIVIRLWYMLFGSPFLAAGMSDLALGFGVVAVVAFLLAILGDWLNHLFHQTWDVPRGLTSYIISLIVCVVFYTAVIASIYIIGSGA